MRPRAGLGAGHPTLGVESGRSHDAAAGFAATIESMLVNAMHRGGGGVLVTADHFAHRESGGFVIDLYWTHSDLGDHFRVEVEDEREGTCFVLPRDKGGTRFRCSSSPRRGSRRVRLGDEPFV